MMTTTTTSTSISPAEAEPLAYQVEEEDIPYEEEVLRNPYSLRSWWRYLTFKGHSSAATSFSTGNTPEDDDQDRESGDHRGGAGKRRGALSEKERLREARYRLYRRALRLLPGSYKLWSHYLRERRAALRSPSYWLGSNASNGAEAASTATNNTTGPTATTTGQKLGLSCISTSRAHQSVSRCFEQALVTMHKMPRIWEEYLEHLCETPNISKIRRTFDRALQSLPVTQHERIWKPYTAWAERLDLPETALRVWRRYLKLDPAKGEPFVAYLLSVECYDEAAKQMVRLVDDPDFESAEGKSRHQLWLQLCKLCAEHPTHIRSIRAEAVIRAGILKFTDQVAELWTSLAAYYTRLGHFEKARDIFEEALASVKTVRDFSSVWDAYTHFSETILTADMEAQDDEDADLTPEDELDFEMRMAGFERLLERRPLLLNAVLLRQNPHNVAEWHTRVSVLEEQGDFRQVVETYKEALRTVDPFLVPGVRFHQHSSRTVKPGPHSLWIGFARFYDRHGMLAAARKVYARASLARYASLPQLAAVWADRIECELGHRHYRRALSLLHAALEVPAQFEKLPQLTAAASAHAASSSSSAAARPGATTNERNNRRKHQQQAPKQQQNLQSQLFRSTRLWHLLADLEESVGSFDSTCAVYEQMLDLKVATPQTVLNYAHYLEEQRHYEQSFRAYERGVSLFQWPYVGEIWRHYLHRFAQRYGGSKLERSRDLFEQCLESAPPEHCRLVYLMYAELEEQHGLARHALAIYDRACRHVAEEDQPQMYQLYVGRATALFGVGRTREIFEQAIARLRHDQVADICVQFATLETKLGEIDRARSILAHGAQYCDPTHRMDYWKNWHQFEVQHGNEETFAEMLRLRRSVQAQYSSQINLVKAARSGSSAGDLIDTGINKRKRTTTDQMEALDSQAEATNASAAARGDGQLKATEGVVIAHNSEDMELDEDSDDSDNDDDTEARAQDPSASESSADVEQVNVPAAVFGALADKAQSLAQQQQESSESTASLGALARLQKRGRVE
mmetsp:Transcript_16009/g.48093  ORF Transcript_16009/g.48093 Transcript_16009/m.48093 type:complete len:1025 (+) Transcript_16009:175-3249(+)